MNRIATLGAILLTFFAPCETQGHHGQKIDLAPGANYVTIVVELGENSLAELMPDAPVGTAIFKFDNALGYQVSQLYSNGWSNPEMTLKPRETAIMFPPYNRKYYHELEGERAYPLPDVYRGWNLLPIEALYPLFPLTERIIPKSEDEIWTPLPAGFARTVYNATEQNWPGLRLPHDGFWYYAKEWPANPAGEFQMRGAIYFNNFAPAFGVDEPFLDANGCPREGSATLLKQTEAGAWEAVGDSVPVENGYINSRHDLMRYIKMDNELASITLAVSLQTPNGVITSKPFPVFPWKGLYPIGLTGIEWGKRPRFRTNPATVITAPGSSAQFKATFNYVDGADTINSVAVVQECAGGSLDYCDVRYQWQQLTSPGQWQDIAGATNTTLRFEGVSESDYGAVRLKAAWGCREDVSAAASLLRPLGLDLSEGLDPGTFELTVTAIGTARVELQISQDLSNWQPHAAREKPTEPWKLSIPKTAPKIFIRALVMP